MSETFSLLGENGGKRIDTDRDITEKNKKMKKHKP